TISKRYWSSDVCSSDLVRHRLSNQLRILVQLVAAGGRDAGLDIRTVALARTTSTSLLCHADHVTRRPTFLEQNQAACRALQSRERPYTHPSGPPSRQARSATPIRWSLAAAWCRMLEVSVTEGRCPCWHSRDTRRTRRRGSGCLRSARSWMSAGSMPWSRAASSSRRTGAVTP